MSTQQTDPIRIIHFEFEKQQKTKHQLYFLSFRWVSNPVWMFCWSLAYPLFQVALPGYVETFPHPCYPQGSSPRLPLHYARPWIIIIQDGSSQTSFVLVLSYPVYIYLNIFSLHIFSCASQLQNILLQPASPNVVRNCFFSKVLFTSNWESPSRK